MSKRIPEPSLQVSKTPWQSIAIASGTCAALNAIFAKLTTSTLTTSLSSQVSEMLSLSPNMQQYLDIVLRAAIFGLSFLFTGTMWALYTKALSASPSAVKVNIVNTASNFIITALLGAIVFGEKLPLLWWMGAGLLVAGSVVIGRREEGGDEVGNEKKSQ